MCYLIVKDINKQGCIAYKTRIGRELADLTKELNIIAPRKGIQVVTISRPTAYGEYAPYTFVDDVEALKNAVLAM
jgi:hypothetical protein